MFNLDIALFNYLYNACKSLGGVFGYGAFEGLVAYAGIILLGFNVATKKERKK